MFVMKTTDEMADSENENKIRSKSAALYNNRSVCRYCFGGVKLKTVANEHDKLQTNVLLFCILMHVCNSVTTCYRAHR